MLLLCLALLSASAHLQAAPSRRSITTEQLVEHTGSAGDFLHQLPFSGDALSVLDGLVEELDDERFVERTRRRLADAPQYTRLIGLRQLERDGREVDAARIRLVGQLRQLRESLETLRSARLAPEDALLIERFLTKHWSANDDNPIESFRIFTRQRRDTSNTTAANDTTTEAPTSWLTTIVDTIDTSVNLYDQIDQTIQPLLIPITIACDPCGVALAAARTSTCLWKNRRAVNNLGWNKDTADLSLCSIHSLWAFSTATAGVAYAALQANRTYHVVKPAINEYFWGDGNLTKLENMTEFSSFGIGSYWGDGEEEAVTTERPVIEELVVPTSFVRPTAPTTTTRQPSQIVIRVPPNLVVKQTVKLSVRPSVESQEIRPAAMLVEARIQPAALLFQPTFGRLRSKFEYF